MFGVYKGPIQPTFILLKLLDWNCTHTFGSRNNLQLLKCFHFYYGNDKLTSGPESAPQLKKIFFVWFSIFKAV